LDTKASYPESIEAFNTAAKLLASSGKPPRAQVFFYLGSVHEKSKEYKKAVLNYKKCLTIDSKHFGACIHLANLLANVGEG
jgi:predicted TPR repeat methyltransferase